MPQHTDVQLAQLLVWCGPRRISEAPAKCMFVNTYRCRAWSIKCKPNLVSTADLGFIGLKVCCVSISVWPLCQGVCLTG